MFILEHAVPEKFWAPRLQYIQRLYKRGCWRNVGLGVIEVYSPLYFNVKWYVAMTNKTNPRPKGWIEVWRRKGWKGWDASQTWVFPEFRGKGLARRFYRAIIDIDGEILYSGASHSRYARRLWASFVRDGLFAMHAQNLDNCRERCDVVWADDQLYSAIPLYSDSHDQKQRTKLKRDIRLVAYRKKEAT